MEDNVINGIFSNSFWYIAPIIVNIVTIVTGYINKWFSVEKVIIKQVISWALASLLSVGCWYIHLISFGKPTWLGILALCIVTSLSSNGYYEIRVIKNFIKNITSK